VRLVEGVHFMIFAIVVYLVDFGRVVRHFRVGLPFLRAVLPGRFSELVDDVHIFFCGNVALIVGHYAFSAHGLGSGVAVRCYDANLLVSLC